MEQARSICLPRPSVWGKKEAKTTGVKMTLNRADLRIIVNMESKGWLVHSINDKHPLIREGE